MLNFNEKISYLFTSAYNYFNKVECPYCLQGNAKVIDRKYLVTRLFECNFCHLYFRHPIDKVDKSVKFYQNNYFESDHITTDLPNKAELNHLIEINFNPDKNANQLITLFKILISNIESTKIVDYGANWGYTTYQLLKNNFQVQAYEISKPRAFFGIKNLGIDIKVDEKDLETDNDIFFCLSSGLLNFSSTNFNLFDGRAEKYTTRPSLNSGVFVSRKVVDSSIVSSLLYDSFNSSLIDDSIICSVSKRFL